MPKSSDYWKDRFGQIEAASNAYGQDVYRQIESVFIETQKELQATIDLWYARVAKNNEISMQDAKKLLNAKELAELKWNVKQFIKYGQENALDHTWMKQLENASARFHINRLEALKIQTQQQMEKAFGNELDEIDTMAREVYSDTFYHSAYEIHKGFNVAFDIAAIDERKLDKLISKPWAADGKNFSNRIWQSKSTMVNELHNELVKMCIMGKSPDEAIKHMSQFVDKKFKNAKVQAGRLVMTEQAFFASAAQKDCFNDLDVEEFEVVATLDSRTSETCQYMDGKHFPMVDFKPGVTAPPFHVWCRSTTVPYFNDEWSGGMRAARGEDGKTYYVPSNMNYHEWKKSFVDGGSKDGLKPSVVSVILNDKNTAKAIDLMVLDVDDGASKFTKQDIFDEIEKSLIGKQTLKHIEDSDVSINLINKMQVHTYRGEQIGKNIKIYLDNIKNVRICAQTIIHEMAHYYYNIGRCQHAEAICFAMEKMHILNRDYLTVDEWNQMVKIAVDNYPELEWEVGGYGNFEQFNFIRGIK